MIPPILFCLADAYSARFWRTSSFIRQPGGGPSVKLIAIIPARGGSKRVPRKNIRTFHGKPMIAWSIGAALESHVFERVVVSTDDEEIADVSSAWGAEVPFYRPSNLADDLTMTIDVMRHAVSELGTEAAEGFACIYPTAPLIQSVALIEAANRVAGIDPGYVFAATKFSYPVQRSFEISESGQSRMREPQNYFVRSQDLPAVYHDAGQFYFGSTRTWQECENFFDPGYPLILPEAEVQDIDEESDWRMADLKFRSLREHSQTATSPDY